MIFSNSNFFSQKWGHCSRCSVFTRALLYNVFCFYLSITILCVLSLPERYWSTCSVFTRALLYDVFRFLPEHYCMMCSVFTWALSKYMFSFYLSVTNVTVVHTCVLFLPERYYSTCSRLTAAFPGPQCPTSGSGCSSRSPPPRYCRSSVTCGQPHSLNWIKAKLRSLYYNIHT